MNTKTVRLNEFFSIFDGVVCEYTPLCDVWLDDGTIQHRPPVWTPVFRPGDEVVLVKINGRDGKDSYAIRIAPNGIPGNMNRNIKRFHGWRGTTNDVSVTALGRREIKKIRTLKNGSVAVTVGTDLDPSEP